MSRQEFTSYCSICGGPILGSRSEGSWISRVTLLSESKPYILSQDVQNKHLQHEPDLVFQLVSEDGIHETAAELNFRGRGQFRFFRTGESTHRNLNQPLLIPVHAACLNIAKQVIRVRASSLTKECSPGKVTSIQRLWKVLESRYLETVEGVRGRKPMRLKAPQNYHMPSSLGGIGWSDDESDEVLSPYEANPLNIPDLSSHVVSCLQAYSQDGACNATPTHMKLAGKLRSLPVELFDLIIDAMGPIQNLPIQCTRIVEPVYWQRLVCGKFLPYLWDLDISVIQSCLSDEKWDYELLVRQLAQEGIWDYFKKNDPGKYSHGLWNRRRIWRLVEEMEIGDAIVVKELPTQEEIFETVASILQRGPPPKRAALSVVIPTVTFI